MTPQPQGFLRADGRRIVDGDGREVRLRGFAFAGWLNLENFMTGLPGDEHGLRTALARTAGEAKAARFLDGLLDHFITERDFALLAGLGCNLVRLPFNYRHFESDAHPFAWREQGFARFDQAISWARTHGIRLILDLHAAPGGQNPHFHADNLCPYAHFWEHPHFQERAVRLWGEIARRYADEPVIAAYDLLNEPIPPDAAALNRFHRQAIAAIRAVDRIHLINLEGEGYSTRFAGLEHPDDPNLMYSIHWYAAPGTEVMEYPGTWAWDGTRWDRGRLEREYAERTAWIRERGVPHWFSEFSIVFTPLVPLASRLRYLADMLAVAEAAGDAWSFGIWKDLGNTGLVHVRPDSPWMRRTAPLRQAVDELRCSPFGANRAANRTDELCLELGRLAHERLAPLGDADGIEGQRNHLRYHLGEIACSRRLQPLFARFIAGLDDAAIDELTASFDTAQCTPSQGWMDAIRAVTGATP